MFKTASRVKNLIVVNAIIANENRAYRKESRRLENEKKAYDEMIRTAQARIGPYKHVTYVPVVWA